MIGNAKTKDVVDMRTKMLFGAKRNARNAKSVKKETYVKPAKGTGK